MTINLYVGDTNSELANQVLAVDPQAFLIDHSNYAEFLNNPPVDNVTVYTSPGDLPKISKDIFFHQAPVFTTPINKQVIL